MNAALIVEIITFGMAAKARMKQLGKRNVRIKCPRHDTPSDQGPYVYCRLAGKKDHLHMVCESPGCMQLVE